MARIDDMRERYEKFSQGDIPGATDLWADDFVWQGPNAGEVPGSGEHQGKPAALEVLGQAVGAWAEYVLTADEFFERSEEHTSELQSRHSLVCRLLLDK